MRRKINGEALQRELDKRNLKSGDVSKEMGYSSTLISNAKYEGLIGEPVIKMLETLYHIAPETYLADSQPTRQVAEHIDLGGVREDIKALTQAVEDMAYAIRLVSGHVSEIKHALGVEEVLVDED